MKGPNELLLEDELDELLEPPLVEVLDELLDELPPFIFDLFAALFKLYIVKLYVIVPINSTKNVYEIISN